MELKPGSPRHVQISDWLRDAILAGRLSVDERVPSEAEIGSLFGVSRITARNALNSLEAEGFIYRRQGLGSFVRDRHMSQDLVRLTDFVEDMQRAGLQAGSRVIAREPVGAVPGAAEALGIEKGATVIRLDRLRIGGKEPIAFDQTWMIPFYAQLLEGHDLEKETIYHILEADYGIPILMGRLRIQAVGATTTVAEQLGVRRNSPVLLVERTSKSVGEKAIYFQRRYYRSDRVAFQIELARGEDQPGLASQGLPIRDFEPVFR